MCSVGCTLTGNSRGHCQQSICFWEAPPQERTAAAAGSIPPAPRRASRARGDGALPPPCAPSLSLPTLLLALWSALFLATPHLIPVVNPIPAHDGGQDLTPPTRQWGLELGNVVGGGAPRTIRRVQLYGTYLNMETNNLWATLLLPVLAWPLGHFNN